MLQISDCIKRFGISTALVWSPDTNVFKLYQVLTFPASLGLTYGLKLELKQMQDLFQFTVFSNPLDMKFLRVLFHSTR